MTAQNLDNLTLINNVAVTDQDEEFSIPLDISDIIAICKEFNKLGWQIQNQIENILDLGVEESIKSGIVNQKSLPFIKSFLSSVSKNAYFGDAVAQAEECIHLISEYENNSQLELN